MRRDLESVVLHGPKKEDSIAMGWHPRQVLGMRRREPELVAEAVKPAEVALVA
jgi:hypothetical protein